MAASPGGPYYINSRTGTHGSKRGPHRHKGASSAPHHTSARMGSINHPVHHHHTPGAGSHEPAIFRSHATLQAFDSGTYLATVQLTRSPSTTIANVPVSKAIAAANMVVGHV